MCVPWALPGGDRPHQSQWGMCGYFLLQLVELIKAYALAFFAAGNRGQQSLMTPT